MDAQPAEPTPDTPPSPDVVPSPRLTSEPAEAPPEPAPEPAPEPKRGAAGGESSELVDKPKRKRRGRPPLSPEEKQRRKEERAAARKAKREAEKASKEAAKLRAKAAPPPPGVFAGAPDAGTATGGVPPELAAQLQAEAAAAGVDLVELAKPENLAPIIVGGVDGIVCAAGSVRYGKHAAKQLSLDKQGREMCERATAAYVASVQIQMTPGQALLLAFALAYAPRMVEVEMAHQAKRGAKTPEEVKKG